MLNPAGTEIVLAILPGASDFQRTVLIRRSAEANDPSIFELRTESWDRGLGWYVQQSIQLDVEQFSGLKTALGSHLPAFQGEKKTATNLRRRQSDLNPLLRVVRADSA